MKTFLIAVSGMSPAIITETLWALATESPPVVPDEVVVITTLKGEADIHDHLLKPLPGWGSRKVWEQLRQDIFTQVDLPRTSRKLQLSVRVIELSDPASGIKTKASDVRSKEDNAEAADFILQTLIPLVDAADHHVIASIAGGRKTMGALLYSCMSLVGRETDRVTHVLVNEPFDQTRGFFYPNQPVKALSASNPATKEAHPVSAEDAVIELANVPFVPLRNLFLEMREKTLSFSGLVNRYTNDLKLAPGKKPRIAFDEFSKKLIVEGKPVKLSGRGLLAAMFSFDHLVEYGHPHRNLDDAEEPYVAYYRKLKAKDPKHPAIIKIIAGEPDRTNLSQGLSEIKRAMIQAGVSQSIIDQLLGKGVGFAGELT